MNDTPHPSPDQLAAFDAGRLSPMEQTVVEEHVASCAACCRRLEAVPEDPFAALVRAFGGSRPGDTDTEPGRGSPPDLDVPDPLVGHPRYRVLECVGAGGMGVVYKAVHLLMGRVVALKVLHARLTARPDFVERFRREVRAAARLSHPNIVTAHDADQAGDLHFLIMEYVPGAALDRLVAQRGPLPVGEACEYVRQAALGLQHAHERGLVHRDVKPHNLILVGGGVVSGEWSGRPGSGPDVTPREGRRPVDQPPLTTHHSPTVKILDFGLARLADDATDPSAPVLGTPDYIAPEQARSPGGADIRADVYGLGGTLFFLLTGRPPFAGETALQKLLAHQECPPPRVTDHRPDVPAELAALLERMLAKDPARRPATPLDVARELARFADAGTGPLPEAPARPVRRPRRVRALVAGGVCAAALAVGLLVWLVLRDRGAPGPDETLPGQPFQTPTRSDVLTEAQLRSLRKERRDQAINWLRENNRWGPAAPIVADTARDLDANLDRMGGFQLHFGSFLLRSNRAAVLAGHPGGFFVFEPTDEQVRALRFRESHRIFIRYHKGTEPRRRATPRARLSGLRIDDRFSAGRPITGSVVCECEDPGKGNYALRLSFHQNKERITAIHYLDRPLRRGTGPLPFSFPPLNALRSRPPGLVVAFMELSSEDGETVIESNAVAALVRLAN